MATNLPRKSSVQLSGSVDQFKPTVLKRGVEILTLSANYGSKTINIDDVFNPTDEMNLPRVEVVWLSSGGGTTSYVPLPFVRYSGGAVTAQGSFDVSTYVDPDGNHLDITVNMYRASYSQADQRLYYVVYSLGQAPMSFFMDDEWNYN